jgi:hypothetical protein
MAKHKRFVTREGWYRVDTLPLNELVKRGPTAIKIYKLVGYDRQVKAYMLDHIDDISRQSYIRGSTQVWAGFEY